MTTYLFDTSVLIEVERGADLRVPQNIDWAVSTITIAELNIGFLRSTTPRDQNRRLTTFLAAGNVVTLPFDDATARTYAEVVVWAESEGIRPSPADTIIAATAVTNGLPLVTFDRGFERLAGYEDLELIQLAHAGD